MNGMSSTQVDKLFNSPHHVAMRKKNEEKKRVEARLKSAKLDDLVSEALSYHNAIEEEHKKGIRDSEKLDDLYDLSAKFEDGLWRRIFNGENATKKVQIDGQEFSLDLLNYVFVRFHRNESSDYGMRGNPSRIRYSPSAFSFLPKVASFISEVSELKEEKYVLTVHNSGYRNSSNFKFAYAETGEIFGSPSVKLHVMGDCHHRDIVIPVGKKSRLGHDEQSWKEVNDDFKDSFDIDNGFFKTPNKPSIRIAGMSKPKGIELEVTHGPYLGGSVAFKNMALYIGNSVSEPVIKRVSSSSHEF